MTLLGTSNRFANHLDVHFLKKGEKAGSFHFLLGRYIHSWGDSPVSRWVGSWEVLLCHTHLPLMLMMKMMTMIVMMMMILMMMMFY